MGNFQRCARLKELIPEASIPIPQFYVTFMTKSFIQYECCAADNTFTTPCIVNELIFLSFMGIFWLISDKKPFDL